MCTLEGAEVKISYSLLLLLFHLTSVLKREEVAQFLSEAFSCIHISLLVTRSKFENFFFSLIFKKI